MIVADILGSWHDIEATAIDPETRQQVTYRDQQRLPQFLHDIGNMPWQDMAGQASDNIPPEPSVCVWRVWPTAAQLASLEAAENYVVLRKEEVGNAGESPAGW
jgi:hypothetical protein